MPEGAERDFIEMKSWVGWTEDDEQRLLSLLPLIEPHVVRVIDRFYHEIERHPGAASVLDGPEQIERLKGTLRRWLREVFEGPHDTRYALRRRAIGRRHVQVGLPDRYMYLAMHVIQSELSTIILRTFDAAAPYCASLHKALTIDLALMTGTYVVGREQLQFDVLHSLLVRHLRLSVFLLDADGIVRSATDASARLCGLPAPVGRPWREVLPPGLVEGGGLDVQVERAVRRSREITLPRVDLTSDDGSTRSFRVHIVPLEHELATVLLQLEELTDAVDMEARLRKSESLAQLGALSAAVSHELRNPLAGISGALQVITSSLPQDAPHRPILSKVELEVRRLNGLVSDLLAFAKPKQPTCSTVALAPLVAETIELIQGDHPQVRWEQAGEGSAWADPDLVRQVLHNLLRNAVDAVNGDGVVRVSCSDGVLQVADDGPGVPAASRDSLFEPFHTTKTRGTGLGLAISKRNAESMGGTLRCVDSGPLLGACFELWLATDAPAS